MDKGLIVVAIFIEVVAKAGLGESVNSLSRFALDSCKMAGMFSNKSVKVPDGNFARSFSDNAEILLVNAWLAMTN